jgi:hypothetical protein
MRLGTRVGAREGNLLGLELGLRMVTSLGMLEGNNEGTPLGMSLEPLEGAIKGTLLGMELCIDLGTPLVPLEGAREGVKILPLPQPSLRARTDARTNPSAQRATQLRSVLARVYAVSRQNQITNTVP